MLASLMYSIEIVLKVVDNNKKGFYLNHNLFPKMLYFFFYLFII